jgi:50S ribosomal protein L16 3-hydroxylase
VVLDLRTQMLYDSRHVFVNGVTESAANLDMGPLHTLANSRALFAVDLHSDPLLAMLHRWYEAGYLHPGVGKT